MPGGDYFILMGVGGLFIILGLAAIIWGKHVEKSFFDAIATRIGDLREFMEHWPPRPHAGAALSARNRPGQPAAPSASE